MMATANDVEVRIRFVVGETADFCKEAVDQLRETWAVRFLTERGFNVSRPREKGETPSEFCARLGLSHTAPRRALRRTGCPNVEVIYYNPAKRGRIREIRSNADFDAFATSYKTQRKKNYGR